VRETLLVAVGGGAGAVARHLVNWWMHRWFPPGGFPAATFAVNVVGCFLIGLIMAALENARLQPGANQTGLRELQLLLVTGVLGGLTTFSTFGYETVELARQSNPRMATWNVVASVVLGLAAVWLGRWLLTRHS
jgi:CrcB protein